MDHPGPSTSVSDVTRSWEWLNVLDKDRVYHSLCDNDKHFVPILTGLYF
jgi:hypothetical protein